MTVNLDSAPNGDFNVPESFADGRPVQMSARRHQVILDAATGRFSVVFMNTITWLEPFEWNGARVRLGRVGERFRIAGSGLLQSPGVFNFAGYAVLGGRGVLPVLTGEPGD